MAKPNYSFEKRQREIAKQKKKAEKLARKQGAKDSQDGPDGQAPGTADNDTPATPGS